MTTANPEANQNLDVHGAMEIFHAWTRNGGKRPDSVARLLPAPFPKGQFGGKSENMKLARAVLNGLEFDDWTNLGLLLNRYAVYGHQGDEIFPASHDQINHASAGAALVAVGRKTGMGSLLDLLIDWHQRQFHLCRLVDTLLLRDNKGRPVGPWGPGARAEANKLYGNNGGRTLAYYTAQGQMPRTAQLADRGNAGAVAIKSLPASVRAHLLEVPKTLVLATKLHIGRRSGSAQDYIAWFTDAPADYVAVAGVWDGEPFASREFGLDNDVEKIKACVDILVVG